MYRDFKQIAGVGNGSYIYYWQSKGLSEEKKLVLLQRVIIVLPQTSVVMLLKREKNVKEAVRNKIHLIMEK